MFPSAGEWIEQKTLGRVNDYITPVLNEVLKEIMSINVTKVQEVMR